MDMDDLSDYRQFTGRTSKRQVLHDLLLQSAAPLSKVQLARLLRMSRQTVTDYLLDGIDDGFIRKSEYVQATSGAPAHLYEIACVSLNDLAQFYAEDWIHLPDNRTCMLIHSGNAAGLLALVNWGLSK